MGFNFEKFVFLFFNYFLVGVVYSFIIYFLLKGKRPLALKMLLGLFLAWGTSFLIKSLFYFPRPYITLGMEPSFSQPSDGSFPSAHTATTFVLGFMTLRHHRKVGFNLLILAGVVAATRVAYSFHSWIDVAGGILLAKAIDSWQSN